MNHYQTAAFTKAIKMKQSPFSGIFPPKVSARCNNAAVELFGNTGEYVAQIKFGGTHVMIHTNGKEVEIRTTTGQRLPMLENHPNIDFKGLALTGNWYCFMGTYLNKGLYNEKGTKERNRLVIWDVLVWDGAMLTGKTSPDRLALLRCDAMIETKYFLATQYTGILVSPYYTGQFKTLWESIQHPTLFEGIILKQKSTTLQPPLQELSNSEGMIKCRKETLLYKY